MSEVEYLYDKKGNQKSVLFDLAKLQKRTKSPNKELNDIQIELLRMFANNLPDEYIIEFKKAMANFLVEKILDRGDEICEERGYTKETFENMVEND